MKNLSTSRFYRTIQYALPCLPILLTLFILFTRGSILPYWDEWNATTPIAIKTAQGTLTLADLFRQHNEHKIVFTKITTALVTILTQWNMRVESFVSVLLGGLIFVLVLINLRKLDQRSLVLQATIASALIFSLRDYGNIILPFQTQAFYVMVFFVGAVTALYCMDKRWLALIIAALCSMGAVFSFLAGWLLWPLIFLMLPFSGYRNWRYLSFWLLATLVTAGLFFLTGYHFTNSSAVNEIAVPFYIYPYYILAYLGSMFAPGSAWSIPLAVTIGILGIGLISINVFFLYRQHVQYRELAFWLLLAGYSVGSAVLSAIGRSGLFITSVSNQLLEPRYVLHTFPFWLAAIFLTLKVLHQIAQNSNLHSSQRLLRRFDHFALGSLLALYVVINGLLIVFIRPVITPDQVACAKAYPVTQDISCMKGIYPDDALNTIQPTLDSLYKNRLSVYRDVSR